MSTSSIAGSDAIVLFLVCLDTSKPAILVLMADSSPVDTKEKVDLCNAKRDRIMKAWIALKVRYPFCQLGYVSVSSNLDCITISGMRMFVHVYSLGL